MNSLIIGTMPAIAVIVLRLDDEKVTRSLLLSRIVYLSKRGSLHFSRSASIFVTLAIRFTLLIIAGKVVGD